MTEEKTSSRYATPEAEARAATSRRITTAARNRALRRLQDAHAEEYRRLYNEEVSAGWAAENPPSLVDN